MFSRRTPVALVAAASSFCALSGVFGAPAALASSNPPVEPMSLAAGSLPLVLTRSVPIQGGDVATTWSGSGVVVKAAGPPGSVVNLQQIAPHRAVVSVMPPAFATDSAQAYAQAGRSIYSDALAVGDTPTQAAAVARSMGAAAPGASNPLVASGSIFNSGCANVNGDYLGNGLYAIIGQACIIQRWLQTGSGGCHCWYSSNSVQGTGYSDSGDTDITQLQGWYCYCNGHTYTRDAMSPQTPINVGSPTTYTLTATWLGFGVSISESQYPQTLKPYWPNGIENAAAGSTWNGSNKNYISDAANSVAIVNPGVGSPGAAGVYVGVGWN